MSTLTRAFFAFFASTIFAAIIANPIISELKKLKLKQIFREKSEVRDLADLHAAKAGTPTLGGIMILIPCLICTLCFAKLNTSVLATLTIYIGLSILGFCDDFLKISKKNTKGIPGKKKLIVQLILSAACFLMLKFDAQTTLLTETILVPFTNGISLAILPVIMFVFFFLVLAGTSNAVNLTDGLDGLAASQIIINTVFFGTACYILGSHDTFSIVARAHWTSQLIPQIAELSVFCSSLAGATLIFWWHNCSPASVFMGDTGSLAIGGALGMIALATHRPFLLIITGMVFVAEAISVILQVYYYKFTGGKRIFRMAPIHHHFELGGMREQKIVIRALIFTLISTVLAIMVLKFY